MLSIFLIKKQVFLRLYDNTKITMKLVQMSPTGENLESIQSSFAYTFDVPIEGNEFALDYAYKVEHYNSFIKNEECELSLSVKTPFKGYLSVDEVSEKSVSLKLNFNPLWSIKDKKVNELDFGAAVATFPTMQSQLDLFFDTINQPENYDYSFFQVSNFVPNGTSSFGFDLGQNIPSDGDAYYSKYITPFFKVSYILEHLFKIDGFTFLNLWQNDLELKRLYTYNNYSLINAAGTFTNTYKWADIEPNNHVPNTNASQWLRNMMALFNLMINVSYTRKTIELIPIKSIFDFPVAKHDWTDKLIVIATINEYENATGFEYPQGDDFYDKDIDSLPIIASNITPIPNTDYYYPAIQKVLIALPGGGFSSKRVRRKIQFSTDNVYKSTISLPDTDRPLDWNPGFNQPDEVNIRVDHAIYNKYLNELNELGTDYLMFYRGIKTSPVNPFPERSYANVDVSEIDAKDYVSAPFDRCVLNEKIGSSIIQHGLAQYSLEWAGKYGLYETWHKGTRYRRKVKAKLLLTTEDIISFESKDLVQIQGSIFFVLEIQVTASHAGISTADVTMLTVA